MTEKEEELLGMFRCLDMYEKNIIIGKISELILNKKKESSIFLRKRKLGMCLLFLCLLVNFNFPFNNQNNVK
ncbi:hypothetical protein J2Z76_002932 [Sedimentibacter acidaminivorans]|uniref:Uncharacterized protein n=1 Tax=Sedimentibacter acidaminivorans TaxID=913099 RepID=A0ABS4GI67_9FIRM|nr:hypothetical protein [Sedimentibacter acidaminivorans]MBP1927060.1 hypothetical protein [Sedimentibacter acidaminivorans]